MKSNLHYFDIKLPDAINKQLRVSHTIKAVLAIQFIMSVGGASISGVFPIVSIKQISK
jgi:hypothetical protein